MVDTKTSESTAQPTKGLAQLLVNTARIGDQPFEGAASSQMIVRLDTQTRKEYLTEGCELNSVQIIDKVQNWKNMVLGHLILILKS